MCSEDKGQDEKGRELAIHGRLRDGCKEGGGASGYECRWRGCKERRHIR